MPPPPRSLLAAGAALYAATAGGTYWWLSRSSAAPGPAQRDGTSSPASWDALAPTYDDRISLDETLMGVSLLRAWHLRGARGRVLEVCAGTGRNLEHYDKGRVSSLTLADASAEMLAVARAKAAALGGDRLPADVRYVTATVADLPQALQGDDDAAGGGFDVVVDTFGLCSVPDPAAALRTLASLTAPGGRIVLIEHGRSGWSWLDGRLDASAAAHSARWGCEWNRDLRAAIDEAGLVVDKESRWHFGTTLVAHVRPPG